MRALFLFPSLLVGLAILADARAQTAPFDSSRATRVDASTGLVMLEVIESDAPAATPALADALLRALGRPWREVANELVAPDTSTVQNDRGDVRWSVPGYPVDGFSAFVQRGLVESVRLDFSADGPDLGGFASRLYDRHGSPRPDGFYATDQTGFPFSLAVDRRANRLDARAVPGQLVGDDVPLPVQFSTVTYRAPEEARVVGSGHASSSEPPPLDGESLVQGVYEISDSIYAYVDTPPETMGGLAAVQRAAVYPEGGQGEGIVYVQVVVEPDGSSTGAVVVRSTEPSLDGAALEAISRLRFRPGRHRGDVVRAQFVVPVRFLPPPTPVRETPPALIGGPEELQRRVRYPMTARRARVQGKLVFVFRVDEGGRVHNLGIDLEASVIYCPRPRSAECQRGKQELIDAAEKAILESMFEPGTRDDEAVSARHSLPLNFVLR